MRHLDDGTLRRMQDDPFFAGDGRRDHLRSCERCRERQAAIAADARHTAALFDADAPMFHTRPALQRVHRSIAQGKPSPAGRLVGWIEGYRSAVRVGFGSVAASLALVGALLFTPAGSLAQSFITIFQPKQVAPVYVTSADLKSLDGLQKYGTVHPPQGAGSHE